MKKSSILLGFVALLSLGPVRAEPPDDGYRPEIKVSPLLRTTTTSAGQPLSYPQTDHPEVTAIFVEIPPGAETGWHKHPFPCFAYILSGRLEVELENGQTNHLVAGQAMAESINLLHNGKNKGTTPVTLVMFVMGETNKPFTQKAASAPKD